MKEMLNVSGIKKDCESKYFFIDGFGDAELTILTDGERVINESAKGKKYPVQEFGVRTSDGKIKTLSLFSKDAMNLIEVIAKKQGVNVDDLKTIVDVKIKFIQTLDDNKNKVLDFICLTESNTEKVI